MEGVYRLQPMDDEEFNKFLDNLEYLGAMIVRIKLKYEHEKDYHYTNEYLSYNGNTGEWDWENDWWEGQQDVQYLGAIMVDDIQVPMFARKEDEDES